MAHGTEQHLEHAEHVQHHALDPFDRRVAMTMAILAAVLAGVTMQSHRAHNQTLAMHIQANDDMTEASNQWAYYQAKKNRQYLYEEQADALGVTAKDPASPDAGPRADQLIQGWRDKAKEYKSDTDKIQTKAESLTVEAKAKLKEAAHLHHRADRFDYGHFGLELALVVCSIAVLTKLRGFWYAGMIVGAVGAAAAFSGYFVGH